MIKYNVINDELRAKYFELVLDTINLKNEKEEKNVEEEEDNDRGSSFYIVKSILYTLIYRNDRICINYIRGEKDINNKSFVFVTNPESDNLSKIFVQVINHYSRTEDLERTLVYDFYVRKIFELMVGKNEFYIKNLENLNCITERSVYMLTSEDVQLEMRGQLYLPFMREIISFCNKMNNCNREFFDFTLTGDAYLLHINDIFKELKNFIFKDINYLPIWRESIQYFQNKLPLMM